MWVIELRVDVVKDTELHLVVLLVEQLEAYIKLLTGLVHDFSAKLEHVVKADFPYIP